MLHKSTKWYCMSHPIDTNLTTFGTCFNMVWQTLNARNMKLGHKKPTGRFRFIFCHELQTSLSQMARAMCCSNGSHNSFPYSIPGEEPQGKWTTWWSRSPTIPPLCCGIPRLQLRHVPAICSTAMKTVIGFVCWTRKGFVQPRAIQAVVHQKQWMGEEHCFHFAKVWMWLYIDQNRDYHLMFQFPFQTADFLELLGHERTFSYIRAISGKSCFRFFLNPKNTVVSSLDKTTWFVFKNWELVIQMKRFWQMVQPTVDDRRSQTRGRQRSEVGPTAEAAGRVWWGKWVHEKLGSWWFFVLKKMWV